MLTGIDKKEVEDYAEKLKGLPNELVYDIVQDTEKLNLKLMIEFENEISRGKRLGLFPGGK